MSVARSIASPIARSLASSIAAAESGGISYADVTPKAIGHWQCQDDAPSAVVIGLKGGNGTLQGGKNTADISAAGPNAILTKSFLLDGSVDYVSTPLTTAVPTLTAAIWAKAAAGTSSNYRQIFCKGNSCFATTFEFAIFYRPHATPASASVGCHFKDAGGVLRTVALVNPAANGVTMTNWNHFIVTITDGEQRLYVNNQLKASSAFTVGIGTTIPVTIGRGNQNDSES